MTRQSISLTPPNDEWLKAQLDSQEYSSKSEIVNDLIRRARRAEQETDYIRSRLIEAEQSGFVENADPSAMLAKFKESMRENADL
jgi:antitoxin ParD1/3/4